MTETDRRVYSRPAVNGRPPVTVIFQTEIEDTATSWAAASAALKTALLRLLLLIAAIWVFGGILTFFIQFSMVFYHDNEHAIHNLIARFTG